MNIYEVVLNVQINSYLFLCSQSLKRLEEGSGLVTLLLALVVPQARLSPSCGSLAHATIALAGCTVSLQAPMKN